VDVPADPPTAEAEQGIPFASETERAIEESDTGSAVPPYAALPIDVMRDAEPHYASPVGSELPAAEPDREPDAPTAASEAADGEREAHEPAYAEASDAAPPRPNDEVLTVTDRPTNPRRGWWRRSP
jgi:hypothetical protein